MKKANNYKQMRKLNGHNKTMSLMEGHCREYRLDLVAQQMTKWGKIVKCRTHTTGLKEKNMKEAISRTVRGWSKSKYPRK